MLPPDHRRLVLPFLDWETLVALRRASADARLLARLRLKQHAEQQFRELKHLERANAALVSSWALAINQFRILAAHDYIRETILRIDKL